jgi:hypothetical protein
VRALFLILVLANLGFFAWSRYVAPADASADPLPLSPQIEPENLKLIQPTDLPPPGARAAPAVPQVTLRCFEWGSFSVADASRAEKTLEPLALGPRLAHRRIEETAGWWVFMPPQGSRAAALKKAVELKARDIDDYFIVQEEGPWRWALSLGVFRTEEAAQARLEALRGQGVRSAQVGARDTVVPKVWLQVKGVDGPLQARLNEAARGMEGSELRECAP